MTNTAKDTSITTPAQLTWRSKSEWGAIGNTYRTEADGWKYVADQPRKGFWQLRGWGPDGLFLYREDKTLKGCKAQAVDHVKDRAAAAAEADRVTAELAATPPVALFVGVDEVAELLSRESGTAAQHLHDLGTALRSPVPAVKFPDHAPSLPQTCGCRTPLHTMRCGDGGRATVVRDVTVRPQRTGRMSVRQPELTVTRKGHAA